VPTAQGTVLGTGLTHEASAPPDDIAHIQVAIEGYAWLLLIACLFRSAYALGKRLGNTSGQLPPGIRPLQQEQGAVDLRVTGPQTKRRKGAQHPFLLSGRGGGCLGFHSLPAPFGFARRLCEIGPVSSSVKLGGCDTSVGTTKSTSVHHNVFSIGTRGCRHADRGGYTVVTVCISALIKRAPVAPGQPQHP
jgi:hypothetical protein